MIVCKLVLSQLDAAFVVEATNGSKAATDGIIGG
jgi:hypothetical protein